MHNTMTKYGFAHDFLRVRPDDFTYEGLLALFDWFEQYEQDTGEAIEFDPIALCCDFTEYEDMEEFRGDYGPEYETIEDIERRTIVIPIQFNSFIIQNF